MDLCRSCNRARAGIFCERDGGVHTPHHTGAIARGYWDERYCCYYLSMLRTRLALEGIEA